MLRPVAAVGLNVLMNYVTQVDHILTGHVSFDAVHVATCRHLDRYGCRIKFVNKDHE